VRMKRSDVATLSGKVAKELFLVISGCCLVGSEAGIRAEKRETRGGGVGLGGSRVWGSVVSQVETEGHRPPGGRVDHCKNRAFSGSRGASGKMKRKMVLKSIRFE